MSALEKQRKILVVDDERSVCESVEKVLIRRGHRVTQAGSAVDALNFIEAGCRFDLILLDLMMPQVGGLEFLKMLADARSQAPVLVITGFASIGSAVDASRLGAVGYLAKPFTPDELAVAVEKALGARRPTQIAGAPAPTDGMIDVDIPFPESEVARAAGNDYVNRLSRSDLPVAAAQSSREPGWCEMGRRACKKFLRKGTCEEAECPLVVAERKKAAKNAGLAAVIPGAIDVDMPFPEEEVEAVCGRAYLDALGRSDIPVVRRWRVEKPVEPARVLVVDDEVAIVNSVRKALVKKGYLVDEAFDGMTALLRLNERRYDIVLLDVRMPDANGLELLPRIKRDWPATRVVIVTGYPSYGSVVEAIGRGASDYLAKPFAPEELYAATGRALQKAA